MRHLMSPLDFSVEELDELLKLAQDIEAHPDKYAHACDGKKLATLFYEPSTRTRLSHEAAMLNLGGSVMGFSSASSSSASKGESVSDTIRTISCYADICAMRHPKEGAPMVACQHSKIPVINAGDGGHQHPTQTLTDLLTILNVKGRLDNMTIGLCGDLKFGRTVHSLITALVRYTGIRFVLISPEELRLPEYIRHDVLDKMNIPYEEVVRLEEAMPKLDILSSPIRTYSSTVCCIQYNVVGLISFYFFSGCSKFGSCIFTLAYSEKPCRNQPGILWILICRYISIS